MSKLRSLLVWLIFVPFTLVWFIPILISALWPPRKRHRMGAFWNATLVYLMNKIVGLRYRVSGLEHIENKPMIICCKHQSGYETLALQRFLPDQVFVIKKELLWFPIFGISLYVMNSIPIDRHRKTAQSREKLMRVVKKRKEQGFWINIFPEGTRVKPGTRGYYHYGAARIAKALQLDILPVATNSGEFWGKGIFKLPGTVDFVIGPPISYRSGEPEEIMRQCEAWIEKTQLTINGRGPLWPRDSSR